MLHILKGDLLDRNNGVQFVLHQTNCESVMGAGIAKSIAQKYPKVAEVDCQFEFAPEKRLGRYSIAKIEKEYYIVNLYAQRFRGKAENEQEQEMRYSHLESALKSFIWDLLTKQRIEKTTFKVGLPYMMGAGLAGGNWERILNILLNVSSQSGVEFYIYKID